MSVMDRQTGSGFGMKKKLMLLFVIIAAVPLVLATVVSSYFSHAALVDSVYENNRLIASSLAREIDGMMAAKIKALIIAANGPEMQSMEPARQLPIMRNIANQYPDMPGVIVARPDGVQTIRTEGALGNIADRAYFKEMLGGAKMVVSELLVAKGTGKVSVILAVPIRDGQDSLRGVLLGSVDLNYLSNYIMQTKIGTTGYAFVVDSKGGVVAHPDQKMDGDDQCRQPGAGQSGHERHGGRRRLRV